MDESNPGEYSRIFLDSQGDDLVVQCSLSKIVGLGLPKADAILDGPFLRSIEVDSPCLEKRR